MSSPQVAGRTGQPTSSATRQNIYLMSYYL